MTTKQTKDQKARALLEKQLKDMKSALGTKSVMTLILYKDGDSSKVVLGNGDEDINLADFSAALFELIGQLYANIILRSIKPPVKKK